jgi:hypothetical protein
VLPQVVCRSLVDKQAGYVVYSRSLLTLGRESYMMMGMPPHLGTSTTP